MVVGISNEEWVRGIKEVMDQLSNIINADLGQRRICMLLAEIAEDRMDMKVLNRIGNPYEFVFVLLNVMLNYISIEELEALLKVIETMKSVFGQNLLSKPESFVNACRICRKVMNEDDNSESLFL